MEAQTEGQVICFFFSSKQALGRLKRLCVCTCMCVCIRMCESDRDWNDISGS